MGGKSPPPTLFLFLSLAVVGIAELTGLSYAASATVIPCHASERKALLEFKGRLVDPLHRLSSWVGEDCCAWQGVGCSNITGHVIHLDLRNRDKRDLDADCAYPSMWPDDDPGCEWTLRGEISESLLSLGHLRHLDLSANSFQRKPIPVFFGSLRSLTYLNLSGAGFSGRVPDQLGNLSRLHHLDLSYNRYYDDDDGTSGILYLKDAGWISRLTSLRHLKMNLVSFANASNWLEALNALPRIQVLELSECELVHFPRSLPHVNFTSMTTLDLSDNYGINSAIPEWLFNITTLEHLHLGRTSFDWLGVPILIAKLTSLRTIDLSENVFQNGTKTVEALSALCNLQSLTLHDVPLNDELLNLQGVFSNSCLMFSLEELDLSYTHLHGSLPKWLGSMKNIKHLDLSGNSLYGSLPSFLGSLSSLQYLDMSDNTLNGTIAEGMFEHMKELIHLDISGNSLYWVHFGNLPSLRYLDISYNSLSLVHFGNIPNLQYLNASSNNLNGTVFKDVLRRMKRLVELHLYSNSLLLSEEHFADLSKLKVLDISQNIMVLNESFEDWIPPFQLTKLCMSSCKILPNPQIPKWIRTQRVLFVLDIHNAGIHGKISNWLPTSLRYLDLSNNQITGHLPYYLPNIMLLDLSNNFFSGELSSTIDKIMPNLSSIDLSMNNLSGSISSAFCELKFLDTVSISNNKLWGSELPDCWKSLSYLSIIDFSNNKLQGELPMSLCNLQWLHILHLNNNNLSGKVPNCLKHYKELVTLDLSHNHFIGNIPTWMGESLLRLEELHLSFNVFTGSIPWQLSILEHLRILDLSNNNLSGIILSSFGNFAQLKDSNHSFYHLSSFYDYEGMQWFDKDIMSLFIKGREFNYSYSSLGLLKSIDLSNNRLTGHIPKELGDLHELLNLNLSKNCLTGGIPSNIKGLQKLEDLDLSTNNLSGVIPSDLAALTFLEYLNLSYNNFSGEVPTGGQLHTFDSSSYVGNPNLCGFPLSKNCTNYTTKGDEEEQREDVEHRIEIICLYASIALGTIIGFWAICGTLLLKRRWRFAFFRYIDDIYDKVYVTVAVKLVNFRRK